MFCLSQVGLHSNRSTSVEVRTSVFQSFDVLLSTLNQSVVYSTVAKNRATSSNAGSPLQKSQPTITLVWLQQMILRASNCSL